MAHAAEADACQPAGEKAMAVSRSADTMRWLRFADSARDVKEAYTKLQLEVKDKLCPRSAPPANLAACVVVVGGGVRAGALEFGM